MSLEQFATLGPVDTVVTSSSSPSPSPSPSSLGQAKGTIGVGRDGIAGAARGEIGPGVSSLQDQLNALHVQPPLKVDGDFAWHSTTASEALVRLSMARAC